MRKGNMPINVILVMLVALISISLLIGLFMTKVPNFAKGIYCNTFFHLHSATFVPDAIRQDQSYCELTRNVDVFSLDNQTKINETITAYILACWERSEFGEMNKPLLCFEIAVPQHNICEAGNANYPGIDECTVSEMEILNIMKNENLCDILPIEVGATGCPTGTTDDLVDTGTLDIEPDAIFAVEFDGTGIQVY